MPENSAVALVDAKSRAAEAALELVADGMVVGLGSGSTAEIFLTLLSARVAAGLRILAIPTSGVIERLARQNSISLTTLDVHPSVDLDIDGADEIDPSMNLLKGAGGALLREKIVAASAKRFVVIADESKRVERLTSTRPLPVEVIPFGWGTTAARITDLGGRPVRRASPSGPFRTDEGNFILDVALSPDQCPIQLAAAFKTLTGVVEHGVFQGLVGETFVGLLDGGVEIRLAPKS